MSKGDLIFYAYLVAFALVAVLVVVVAWGR